MVNVVDNTRITAAIQHIFEQGVPALVEAVAGALDKAGVMSWSDPVAAKATIDFAQAAWSLLLQLEAFRLANAAQAVASGPSTSATQTHQQ